MIYREYGNTGKLVSAIGFGGMRFENQDNREECAELVQAAYESGVNYFDTAPGYAKSEELFGLAFREMKKHRPEKPFYVSTKTMKPSPAEARRDLENSLERMGLEYIDFYHLWCVCHLEDYERRKANGVLNEFEKMKEEGLVRHIVVSTHLPGKDIGRLLKDYPFEGVLLGYSAMNFPQREAGLDIARTQGQGVVVMNPLGGGIIPQHPDLFEFLKTVPSESVVEAALRFLVNDERIDVVLNGMSNKAHLAEAVKAVEGYHPIPAEKIEGMRASLGANFDNLCTTCGYCDNCPVDIPIPKLMDAYNQYQLSGKRDDLLGRLRYHWHIDNVVELIDSCTQCKQCEEECTQDLDILNRMQEIKNHVEQG